MQETKAKSCTIPGKNAALVPISEYFLQPDIELTQHMVGSDSPPSLLRI